MPTNKSCLFEINFNMEAYGTFNKDLRSFINESVLNALNIRNTLISMKVQARKNISSNMVTLVQNYSNYSLKVLDLNKNQF